MNTEITEFCWRAAKRGILTPGQCLVLRELFTEKATLEDCVAFITKNRLTDEKKLKALKLQMKSAPKQVVVREGELLPGEEALADAVTPERTWEPDLGLEWFCYLAVSRKILTREICMYLAADLAEVVDLLSFAQAVVDTGLCRDIHEVQRLTDEALEQWARGKEPPFRVFSGGPEKA